MLNGDVNEFIDGLHYGDERFFSMMATSIFYRGTVLMGSRCLNSM